METSSAHHVSMGLGPKVTQRDRVEKISKMGSRKGFVLTHLLIEIVLVTIYRNLGTLDVKVPVRSFLRLNLPDLCWLPHPEPESLLPLLGSSQLELVSMGFPQADVPLSTVTGGPVAGSPHVEDSFCCE